MGLRDVITRFATGTYTVTRYATGALATGVFTPGSSSTFSIVACVQPQRGREIKVGPEGQTGADVKVVYTKTEVRATPGSPDVVTVDGDPFKVFEVERWDAWGDNHYRAYVARQTVP